MYNQSWNIIEYWHNVPWEDGIRRILEAEPTEGSWYG